MVSKGLRSAAFQQLITSAVNTFATGSNPSTIFAVGSWTGGTTTAIMVGYGNATTAHMRAAGKFNTSNVVYASEYAGDISTSVSWPSSPTLVYAGFGATTEAIGVNGATPLIGSFAPNTPASTALYLGSMVGVNYFWTGQVYEVLVYNATLSTAERQFIEGYLACRWGLLSSLPSNHPYKSGCPSMMTANLNLTLAVLPTTGQIPGSDLTYTTTFTNSSGTIVYTPAITSPVPANTWFKLGTVTQNLGSTGLSVSVAYSNDSGSTYTYTPVSGAGGAASGYDANVTDVRWTLSSAIGPASSINSGSVSFTTRII